MIIFELFVELSSILSRQIHPPALNPLRNLKAGVYCNTSCHCAVNLKYFSLQNPAVNGPLNFQCLLKEWLDTLSLLPSLMTGVFYDTMLTFLKISGSAWLLSRHWVTWARTHYLHLLIATACGGNYRGRCQYTPPHLEAASKTKEYTVCL